MRIELMTSSLPRMRSTPELLRQLPQNSTTFFNKTSEAKLERETGLKPATLSLEG